MKTARLSLWLIAMLLAACYLAPAQAPNVPTAPPPVAPAWSQPGSPTHVRGTAAAGLSQTQQEFRHADWCVSRPV